MSATKKITVGLEERSYPIYIGPETLESLPQYLAECQFPTDIIIVTNTTVSALYGDALNAILEDVGLSVSSIAIEDGEQHKNLSTLSGIFDELVDLNTDRNSGIIALGGGVVGDIAGFAAATFLRGIPYAQIPTTLLAQVDSSVGGKTAVNHPLGKNLIGAFNQPKLVCIDIDVLNSLPEREFKAGLAEVVKYGIIRDREFFDWLRLNRKALLSKDSGALIHAIKTSCQIKADIVEIDEKESSLRAILNFGHTFGHAVESLTGYSDVLHGEAVAIGMVVAARASVERGHCSMQDVDEISDLLSAYGLPVDYPDFSLDEYVSAMMHDKKVRSGTLNMVFNRHIGETVVEAVEKPKDLFARLLG